MTTLFLKVSFSCLFLCLFFSGSAAALSFEREDAGEGPGTGVSRNRIHFTVGNAPLPRQPAVLLGRLGDADEVYLNGVKIGGEGKIGDRFVTAAKAERLYRIPGSLLDPGGKYLLSVRVMDLYPGCRTFEAPATFGDYRELLVQRMELHSLTKKVEFILLTLTLPQGLFLW